MGPWPAHSRIGALLLAVALASTGCGTDDRGTSATPDHGASSGDPGTADDESSTADDGKAPNEGAIERLTTATGALLDRWGDQGAFYVSMAALDAGYTTTQLVAAAVAGTVQADGSVDGVEPERPPAGLLGEVVASHRTRPAQVVPITARTGGAALGAATGDTPADRTIAFVDASLSEMFRAGQEVLRAARWDELMQDFATSVTFLTLVLSARGYAPEQVVEAIVLGTAAPQPDRPSPTALGADPRRLLPCWQVTVDGAVVAPDLPPALGVTCPRIETGSAPTDDDGETPTTDDGDAPTHATPGDQDAAQHSGRFEGSVRFSSDLLDALNPRAFALGGITSDDLVVQVADGQVTDLRFRLSYTYRTCGQGDGTLACTIDATVSGTLAGGSVPITDASAALPLEVTVSTSGCTGSANDCAAHPIGDETSEATARITLSDTTMSGDIVSEGVAAYEFDASG